MNNGDSLHRKALILSYFTLAYNIVEFILSIIAGMLSGSIALISFGLDSLVESLSAGIMVWRFRKHRNISEDEEERIEHRAEKLVGYTFFILAIYILYESIKKLVVSEIPEPSLFGIFIALASIIIMPVLYRMKYDTGKSLNSRSLIADSKETLACVFLSVALLIGLSFNYLFGFWQADPIIGLVIAIFLIREGKEILSNEEEGEES
ncbi:MAG: cation diffusion facilitator family transporter [Dehalogenimonas sp.]